MKSVLLAACVAALCLSACTTTSTPNGVVANAGVQLGSHKLNGGVGGCIDSTLQPVPDASVVVGPVPSVVVAPAPIRAKVYRELPLEK